MPLDEALKDIQKNNDVGKELFWTSNILLFIGIGAWLITAVIRLTPAFSLTPTTLSISGFGLADHFSLTMIKKISVYPLGPLGTLVDVKAPVGFNTRKLLFITQVDKKSLREYLASTPIEIN
ncbi:hypothetical protein [Gallaecimonas mangrovi]|uniref:hypothetical protein n=1 Tax=Gallaecimonas mangrovi TaxID=2291597 RepID=UPI00126018BD|nr:hypothetical protein [Gallaecimonas mangrovi]